MLQRLLRPRAIVSHLLVAMVVVTCVALGQWQLDRLQQVRTHNAEAQERQAAQPLDLNALLTDDGTLDPSAHVHRRAQVRGTYEPAEEVLQRNRSYRNQSGFHVLTPLRLDEETTVLVRRGWVPASLDTPPVGEAPPPPGEVTVTGVLEASVDQPSFGAQDPATGELARVFHADVSRLDPQMSGSLAPMVLRIDTELTNPTEDQLPFPVGPPTLDEGSHLSYAIQWHTFALLALVAYVAWWRRRLRQEHAVAQAVRSKR